VLRGTLADIAYQARSAGLAKQAIVLVGRALDPALRQVSAPNRSNLYDPTYSHGRRLAVGRGTRGAQK